MSDRDELAHKIKVWARAGELAGPTADVLWAAGWRKKPSREAVELFMRGEGLSDEPDKYDSSIHSWRCEHPDRYGKCSCFQEFADSLLALLDGLTETGESNVG